MTQIYTSNTVIVKAKAPIVNYTSGDTATLVCDISVVWIDTSVAQRFLSHKWQTSSNGIDWTDLSNNSNYSSTLDSSLDDITLYEYNISQNKTISSTLDIKQVSLSQNHHKFRCLVFLYNNNQNNIESVGSSESITLNVSAKNTGYSLPHFDIPWDPMNPRGIIEGGNLVLDQNTKIELFKLTQNACGTSWRVIETAYGVTYLNGSVINGKPEGLPTSYGPNTQSYPGYMELQFYCDNTWTTQESWISLLGNEEHVFDILNNISPINIKINGQTIIENTNLGTTDNPLIISPKPGVNNTSEININAAQTDSIDVIWNPTGQAGYGGVLGIIPDSIQTITIPSKYTLPTTVTITGGCDDNLVVNGEVVNDSSPLAGNVNYTFVCSTRTFTVGVYNAIAGGAVYTYNIAFSGNVTSSGGGNNTIRENTTNILTIDQAFTNKSINISANNPNWLNTGINLTDSSRLLISSTGVIEWSNGNLSEPDGVVFEDDSTILYSGIPQSALVGRIGENGNPFYIGSFYNSFINQNGNLYLSINDTNKNDNSGQYSLAIQYVKADPIGIKVTTISNEEFNPLIQDYDYGKVGLLTKIGSDNVGDASLVSRKFVSNNITFNKDITKYSSYSIDYSNNGYSVVNSDSYLSFDRDFTIEGWFYFEQNNVGYQGLITTYKDRDNTGWILIIESNNRLYFYATNSSIYWYWPLGIGTNYTPPLNQWIHIVVQRTGSTVKMYANGVEIGSVSNSLNITNGYKIELGNYPYFSGGRKSFKGYMGEVRVSKFARYPEGSPSIPTSSFPKFPYNTSKQIDISGAQKSATPVYDTTTGSVKYYTINSKSSLIGPYSQPGQLSLVYSYKKNLSSISQQNVCERYFQAFDGSNRFFRKFAFYDTDCCYSGSYRPDDGYYIVSKRCDGQYAVIDSARWYTNNGYAIGDIIHPSDARANNITNVPASIGHPDDSATWRSAGYNSGCCNANGTKRYYELSDEVFLLPTPTPTHITPTPTSTTTPTPTPTPTVTPTVTTSMVSPANDPLFRSVSLLLRMNGSNNSTNIVDSSLSVNTVSTTGNVYITTSDYKFGGSSLLVNTASTDANALYSSAGNPYNMNSNNFTIEFYLKQYGPPQSGAPVFQTSEDSNAGIDIYYPSSLNSLVASLNTTNNENISLSMGSTDNDWNHYAIVRNDNTVTTYKNGSIVSTTFMPINSTINPSSGIVTIGGNINVLPKVSINALLDDLRITKQARYSGAFTPPQFQLSNIAPTQTPTPSRSSS